MVLKTQALESYHWAHVLALLLLSSVALGMFLNLSEPQIIHLSTAIDPPKWSTLRLNEK